MLNYDNWPMVEHYTIYIQVMHMVLLMKRPLDETYNCLKYQIIVFS